MPSATWLLRLLFRLVLLVVLLGATLVAAAAYLAFDRRPAVARTTEFAPDHIARAKQILESNDPRRMKAGAVKTVAVTAADADLALNYLAHRYGRGSAEASFESGRLRVKGSIRIPALPTSPYVNAEVEFVQGSPIPTIEHVRIGQLPLPTVLARAGLGRLIAISGSGDELAVLRAAVRRVEFAESGARVTYEWNADLGETMRAALIDPEGRARLRVYQEALASATRALPRGPVSLAGLLTPLFAVAADRSRTSDPVLENRAAIVVLAFYVDRRPLAEILPEARSGPRPTRHTVTLDTRDDLPKHFMISAALSANTGGPFADAVGVYKEVADANGGSGFSFNDIAADRAGSRLGALAEGRDSARRLQLRLAVPLGERVFMPATDDLPEFMPDAEFTRRFGGIGAPAYARMMADIESRIAALALYR